MKSMIRSACLVLGLGAFVTVAAHASAPVVHKGLKKIVIVSGKTPWKRNAQSVKAIGPKQDDPTPPPPPAVKLRGITYPIDLAKTSLKKTVVPAKRAR